MSDPVVREFLLGFWKIHILHHAEEQGVYGQWMLEELRLHGYRLSPGTLYPLLARMERAGWLQMVKGPNVNRSPKARREYVLTPHGDTSLEQLRRQVEELHHEVIVEARHSKRARRRQRPRP